MSWKNHVSKNRQGRETRIAEVIETVDSEAPATKEDLASHLDISMHYLSEILQEVKKKGLVEKAYVVDEEAVYDEVKDVSKLWETVNQDDNDLLALLERLEEVVFDQYTSTHQEFAGDEPEQTADQLEPLTNERYATVLNELKSYTLTTEWPGSRISADLVSVAKDFEMIGDRCCFISDEIMGEDTTPSGTVTDRVHDIFEVGETIHENVSALIFDCEIDRMEEIHSQEKQVHRDFSELFELTTAYDPAKYGYLITVTRALERIIYYWINAAEISVRLYSGVNPGHVEIS
jgi:predicted transcriptional regulator